jgi:light-regulated signal transduction histidine kinase (bacteriophytochrome)
MTRDNLPAGSLTIDACQDAASLAHAFKEFTYLVSHDLGAPVRGMVEFSRLLQAEYGDVLNDEGKLYLSLIVDSGVKLQKQLAGLLDYSRIDSEAAPFSSIDSGKLFKDCLPRLKDKIDSAKAKIEIMNLPTLTADAEQIERLFTILLDNALTFHGNSSPSVIHISAEAKSDGVTFFIKDNGIGIAREFHQHIFKPFKRLHTDAEYPGVGMGLAIAKKIIDRHHGDIGVTSAPNAGSVFHFTLPAK